ncbi:MAG: thermonuclease family protein [Desulfobulbaceae bacterium]|nr:thermonuclease family protein [Desulfobulbaceae bacterium]
MKMFDAMIGSKNITLAKKTESGKNVTTARVYLNGISINVAMVKSGHAWVTQASCTKIECENWVIFQQFASTNKKRALAGNKTITPMGMAPPTQLSTCNNRKVE